MQKRYAAYNTVCTYCTVDFKFKNKAYNSICIVFLKCCTRKTIVNVNEKFELKLQYLNILTNLAIFQNFVKIYMH